MMKSKITNEDELKKENFELKEKVSELQDIISEQKQEILNLKMQLINLGKIPEDEDETILKKEITAGEGQGQSQTCVRYAIA